MSDISVVPESLLQLDQVVYRTPENRTVLDGLSFAVSRGELVALSGPGGAGKTTVLRLFAAYLKPTSGRVLVGGMDVSRLRRTLLPTLRRQLGIVEQDPSWIGELNVLDNIMLPVLLAGKGRGPARERARMTLERVGLRGCETLLPRMLSGGEQQRAALARAIVRRPSILLVDEPTAHLDASAATALGELLAQFCNGGVAILMATHGDAPTPPRARVLRMAQGRLA
jgi:cell division transport system ATP-binding protein